MDILCTLQRRAARVGSLIVLLPTLGMVASFVAAADEIDGGNEGQRGELRILDLQECIDVALHNNRWRSVSALAVAMAEAQHRQVMSAYWPHITAHGGFVRTDEPPNFIFPPSSFAVPPQTISVPAGVVTVTIPAGAFAPGFPPDDVQMPVNFPGQTFDVPAQELNVPAQDLRLMDEDSWLASIEAKWLLLDGGMRRGLKMQAGAGIEAAKQEARRTDLEVVDSVTRFYWGAVLAQQLLSVGEDTLARMEATLRLTEAMYKEGAGTVKKTDYLSNKVMVDTLRSAVALLEMNVKLAQAALANTMGLAWDASIQPSDAEIPYLPLKGDLSELVADAYVFSPDWNRLQAGITAAEGALKESRSDHFPKVALTGSLAHWWNDYDYGLATEDNKALWNVGVMLEIPVFNGLLTKNRVAVARARLDQIRHQEILLREGLGLQVKAVFLGLEGARARHRATLDAMSAAVENRQLNVRAYQNELVETEDVIQAQLMEALMSAQHFKAVFDHAEYLSRLNLVVGTEVSRRLGLDG